MSSFETKSHAIALGKELAEEIPKRAQASPRAGVWTMAVYDALREHAKGHNLKIYPEEKPYLGEYLCDFMLFEDGHGCRVACESQWTNVRGQHLADIEWAFEKLLGVKSDIKLFIFEGSEREWLTVQEKYLVNYAQLSTEEVFILLRFENVQFSKSWWQPLTNGRQSEKIRFEPF